MEKKATKLFEKIRNQVIKIFPGETNNYELNKYCKSLFGRKFSGVYSANTIPILKRMQSCIINLDNSDKPGSHWIVVCRDNKKCLYFYDSFGRKPQNILPNLLHRYNSYSINYDGKDKEQRKNEENCGANCIAFICVYYELGPNFALKI